MAADRAPVGIAAAEPLPIEAPAERIELGVAISRVAVEGIVTLSVAAQGDMTDRAHAPAVAAALPVWDLEAGASIAVEVVGDVDREPGLRSAG